MRAITLVVDDTAEVRALLDRGLTQAGYDVRLADDGASALAVLWALQGRVDVVLTDIRMPGIDGLLFAEKARLAWPTLPIVIMSAFVDDTVRHHSATLMAPVVTKPFRLADLLNTLRDARL